MDCRSSQSGTPLSLSITFEGLSKNDPIAGHGNRKKNLFCLQIKRKKDKKVYILLTTSVQNHTSFKERIMNLKISGWTLQSFKIIIVMVTSEYKC